MAMTPEALAAKVATLRVGQRFRINWGTEDAPQERETWNGTVKAQVDANTVSVQYDEFPSSEIHLPNPTRRVLVYSFEVKEERTIVDMASAKASRPSLAGIVPYLPKTWGGLLESTDTVFGRYILMTELGKYFACCTRRDLTAFAFAQDYEKATLYDTILAWVLMAQSMEAGQWKQPALLAILEQPILRLCALRRGGTLTGAQRAEAMESVYATLGNEKELSKVMESSPLREGKK